MTSTSRDDLRAFYQAAFKPIMEQVGKAPSPGTVNPSIPMNPSGAYTMNDMMASELDRMSLHGNVKVQPSVPKPTVPLPSIKPSIVTPLIFELKTKLAKLEEELYLENGDQMKQTLDALLVRLDSSYLDEVIEALDPLNHILSKELIYSYEPYLKGSVDRIVLLCAKQYRFFFTAYLKTVDNLEDKNPEQVKRIQKFLDANTKVLLNLLVDDRLKLSAGVSREALHELVLSTVPYLVSYQPTTGRMQSVHGIRFEQVYSLVGSLLFHYTNHAGGHDGTNGLNANRLIVAAVVLRLLHDFIVDSHATEDLAVKQQANLSIDALTSLVTSYMRNFYNGMTATNEVQHLKTVVYEIYSIFEFASEMKTSPLEDNLQVLEKLKSYTCSIFKRFGSEAAWSHFEMVDKELTVAGRDPREVALFKYLAGRGYTRSGQSEVEVEKAASESEVSEPTEFVEIEVVKDTPKSEVNQKSVESNETQQQDPKENPEESVPEKVVPETSVMPTEEVQQLEVEVKDISDADQSRDKFIDAFFKALPEELIHYPTENVVSTSDPIDSDSDSEVVILDLDDDGNESGHQAILKPTKVVAAAPKSVEKPEIVEPTITSSVVVEEEESEKSFEVLKAPEQEVPEVVKMLMVSAPEAPETKESEEPTVETSTVETTTSTTSSTSSASKLSKQSKQEIFAEVQKMHQDLAKSQQMLHELLAKLAANQKMY